MVGNVLETQGFQDRHKHTIWDFETHYDEGNKKERRLATFLYGMFLKCPCTKGLVSTLALLEGTGTNNR